MSTYNVVAAGNESTVVAEYEPQTKRSDAYQSEAALEQAFIKMLEEQGYTYLPIHKSEDLVANLRQQLEALNHYTFTDAEWQGFFSDKIANANDGIVEKTRRIQEDYVQNLTREDGSTVNITLLDRKNIHNNRLQVINQYVETEGKHDTRYDVTILVNGLPLVHAELKRRGVPLKEAFNQINRYQRDSFWAGCGLYEYVQIFVISNGTNTKYYSNTTRDSHIKESNGRTRRNSKKMSNSFEFTSFWADATNHVIPDLVDFTRTFFARHTLLNILTKYCVFTSENLLLVMRPYQIAATERILSRIQTSTNYRKYGTLAAGGYIWHTTGSGKTLTSFKTAQLAARLPYIDKVLFVVDRKDLDYQTMKEYDRFEKGAANGNTSTQVLQRQLEDRDAKGNPHVYKIIITTIQKLALFVARNKGHKVFQKHVVLIFDECHRSQFGDMHIDIVKCFKKYHLFGFTGTPIFAANASSRGKPTLKTTPQAFGGEPDKDGKRVLPLHTYTIVDAINDNNVLPFRIDYVDTVNQKSGVSDKQVKAIDTEKALSDPRRVTKVVEYILEHFDQKTKRNGSSYTFRALQNIEDVATDKQRGQVKEVKSDVHLTGFNSIFAVSSIDMAKAYYLEFKRQMQSWPEAKRLCVATIYSYAANEEVDDANGLLGEENSDNTSGLDASSRDFLESAIQDYNALFKTHYDTSAERFQNYYKDLSLRMKNREVDILIVVNMFLTGFDATTLNTLWVDKNLVMHGLIQAFSRTNRILNSVKTYGNIVCFRNLEDETNKALALFGDRNAGSVVLLKNYKAYYEGYEEDGKYHAGYEDLIAKLQADFPLGAPIVGEQSQKDFIALFGAILRMQNILTAFDEFAGNEILSARDMQDYQSRYIDLYQKLRGQDKAEKETINDDVVFEMELVRQVEVNIDYILMLVAKYHKSNCEDKEILVDIRKAVDSSLQLRSKKELIEQFIQTVNTATNVDADWQKFVQQQKGIDLDALIQAERLKPEETQKFVDNSFRDGVLKTTGTDIDRILPPVSRFGSSNRTAKKNGVIQKLQAFFDKYFGLV